MENKDLVQLRLRLPLYLHKRIIKRAQSMGISLNSYIIKCLSKENKCYFLGSKEFNRKIKEIEERVGGNNYKNLLEELNTLNKHINELEQSLKDDLKNKDLFNLDDEDEFYFENLYPVLVDIKDKNPIQFKIPSIKMVFEPTNDYINAKLQECLREIYNKNNTELFLSMNNIDDIDYMDETPLDRKKLFSFVFNFLITDFVRIDKIINEIINKINSQYKGNDYIIKYFPTYLFKSIKVTHVDDMGES